MNMGPNIRIEGNVSVGEDPRVVNYVTRPQADGGAPRMVNNGDVAAGPVAARVPAPNSSPHEADPYKETYVYCDFAKMPPRALGGAAKLHPQSLRAQKLPAKLALILSDSGASRCGHVEVFDVP